MTPLTENEEAALTFIDDMLDVEHSAAELQNMLHLEGDASDAIASRETLASPAFQAALVERHGDLYEATELLDVVRFLLTSKLLPDEINLVAFGLMNPNLIFMGLSYDVVEDNDGPLAYAGRWIYLNHNPVAPSQIAQERDAAWIVLAFREQAAELLAQIFEVYHEKMVQETGRWTFDYASDLMIPLLKEWAKSSRGSPLRAIGRAMDEISVPEFDGTLERIEFLQSQFQKYDPWALEVDVLAAKAITMGVLYEHSQRTCKCWNGDPVDWRVMAKAIFDAFFPNFPDDGREMSLSDVVEYYNVWNTEMQRLAELAGVPFEPVLARVL